MLSNMPLSPSPRSAELATVRVCVASSQEKSKAAAAAEGTNAIEQKEEADAVSYPNFCIFYAKKKPPVNKKVFHHKNTSLLPGHFYKNSCQTFFSDPYCEAEKKEPQADNTTIR